MLCSTWIFPKFPMQHWSKLGLQVVGMMRNINTVRVLCHLKMNCYNPYVNIASMAIFVMLAYSLIVEVRMIIKDEFSFMLASV